MESLTVRAFCIYFAYIHEYGHGTVYMYIKKGTKYHADTVCPNSFTCKKAIDFFSIISEIIKVKLTYNYIWYLRVL